MPKMSTQTPNLKLFSLQASRSIRIAFLLEELGIAYENKSYERQPSMLSPPEYAIESRSSFGKAPVLHDGGKVLVESGAITEHILENYDTNHTLDGTSSKQTRQKVLEFIHASEAAIMLHCLASLYLRASAPAASSPPSASTIDEMASALAVNVRRDLDWLESELGNNGGEYLAGKFSAADTMMLFGILFIFKRDLTSGKNLNEWTNLNAWVDRCQQRAGWKKAVEKTGFTL